MAQGVDYLIVAPQQEDGLQASLITAMEAGIPVILVDRAVNGEAGTVYTTSIMSDFVWEAEQIAQRVIEFSGGIGNVGIFVGTKVSTSTSDR